MSRVGKPRRRDPEFQKKLSEGWDERRKKAQIRRAAQKRRKQNQKDRKEAEDRKG